MKRIKTHFQRWRLPGGGLGPAVLLFAVVAQAVHTQESLWGQLATQQALLSNAGRPIEAAGFAESMVWLAQRESQPEQLRRSLDTLGESYSQSGSLTRAREAYEYLLAEQEAALGRDNPALTPTLLKLTQTYADLGRPELAEPVFNRLLERNRHHDGLSDAHLNRQWVRVADLYQAQGEAEKAELLLKGMLENKRRVFGEHHRQVADAQQLLADFYTSQGALDQAKDWFRESFSTRELESGSDKTLTGVGAIRMGAFYAALGDEQQAEQYYDYGVSLLNKVFALTPGSSGNQSEMIAQALRRRAQIYADLGLNAESLRNYEQALESFEAFYGPDDMRTVHVLEGYARVLRAMNFNERAAEVEARINAIRLKE